MHWTEHACTMGITINATKTKTRTVGKDYENQTVITTRGKPLKLRSYVALLLSGK